MSQYVIEFGAERVQPIADAISLCLRSLTNIAVDEACQEFQYFKTERSLAKIAANLEAGTVASAVIRCTDERIRYALITKPVIQQAWIIEMDGHD